MLKCVQDYTVQLQILCLNNKGLNIECVIHENPKKKLVSTTLRRSSRLANQFKRVIVDFLLCT